MSPTDAELIARVLASDDRHAFATLVRRHQSAVRALLRKLTGDHARADDLAQETFLRAYRGLAGFRGSARLSTWLYRIAYRAFLSDVRERGAALAELAATAAPVETSAMERVVTRHDLGRAMAALRPEERAALALTYGQDTSHEEAAAILDCPVGTLKTYVLRAKERLRVELADEERR